jgi:hypothetical protein
VHDLIAQRDRLGVLFTNVASDAQTGHSIVKHSIAVLRLLDGTFAEIWLARRSPEYGAWPNLDRNRAEWSVADDPPHSEETAIAAAMARYVEIRQTREAEGLRELFVDPMIVHGPGATREESLDEFVRRVAAEPQTTPGSAAVMQTRSRTLDRQCRRTTALLWAAKPYCDGAIHIRTPPPSSRVRLEG